MNPLQLIYPPLCLSCQQRTGHVRHLFCASCLEHLSLLEPRHRCTRCFVPVETDGLCRNCWTGHAPFKRHAAACERFGPPLALLSHLEKGEFGLVKTVASLMVMQHAALNWPLPDWIIPFPTHLFPALSPQGKITRSIGSQIAQIFDIPLCTALKKEIDFSYFSVPSRQEPTRLALAPPKAIDLADKTLLLISLKLQPEELRRASEKLQGAFPKEINSLCFLDNAS